MESLVPPNTPEEHVYASIYTLLAQGRSAVNKEAAESMEYELRGAEFRGALNILGKYDYDLPDKIALAWLVEPFKETPMGPLNSVKVGFVHLNYAYSTTLYVFTKEFLGEVFCDKEILSERHSEGLEEAKLQRALEIGEPEVEITNEEVGMLSEMLGAILSIHKQK
jgi:hypothetical protein